MSDLTDKLKKYPKIKCAECGTSRSYTNPMARCYECKIKFCFKHIKGGQINKKMSVNDGIRDVCEKDQLKHAYKVL